VRVVAIALLVLVLAPAACAGGDFSDLVVASRGVWTVGPFGVRTLDARTGKTIYAPQPASARYPLSVAVAGGAAWVASVENGYADGELTRIDLRTHRTHVVLRDTIVEVAAGGGAVYALGSGEVVRLSADGRVTGRFPVVDAGRIAADASGCWVSATHRLMHIRTDGRVVEVLQAQLGDIATGDGAAWLPQSTSIVRIDERTAVVRGIRTGALRLGGFQHDLAVGAGALWVGSAIELQRRSPATGRVTASARLPASAQAIGVTRTAVWVASGYDLLRFDPRTLRRTLSIKVD
jgi:hypothetical protein